MRCVIYTRVSTEDQTVENQISQLKEYAEHQNWNIIDIVSDVASGGKSVNERSGLKKVLVMARQRKYDVLLFWSLDRFSREGSRKTLEYLSKLDDFQVKWHSYTEEYISSLGIFADAIISLMACLAKQERIRISERTKAGLERVRSRGKKLGRPQTADVAAIKELRQQGFSLTQIALRCNISRARVHQIVQPESDSIFFEKNKTNPFPKKVSFLAIHLQSLLIKRSAGYREKTLFPITDSTSISF